MHQLLRSAYKPHFRVAFSPRKSLNKPQSPQNHTVWQSNTQVISRWDRFSQFQTHSFPASWCLVWAPSWRRNSGEYYAIVTGQMESWRNTRNTDDPYSGTQATLATTVTNRLMISQRSLPKVESDRRHLAQKVWSGCAELLSPQEFNGQESCT